jgi:hypothetical protein
MRVLIAVVAIPTLPVFHAGQSLTLHRAGAFALLRDAHPWHIGEACEQRAKKRLRCLLVAPTLDENVQDVVVLIHGTLQVMALPMKRQPYLVPVPFVAWSGASLSQRMGIRLPKLPTPLTDGFVGHGDAAFEQEFLHVAVAQGKSRGEPDPMTDDCAGKAVVLVTLGVGRRGHARGPLLGFM